MKRIIYTFLAIVGILLTSVNVYAASGSITVSTSAKQVAVGSTFKATVKVSCSEAIGSWQYGISYDSSVISLQSGDTSVAAYGDGSMKSKSYTYTFKAIKAGTGNIRITGASMVSWDDVDNLFTPSTSNVSVTVKTQADIIASYSKDNTLKSLSVTGFELSPAFDKNQENYSVEVPDDVKSIKVSAKVNDGNASVRGTGEIDVSEGSNKIEVVVTAQNGSTKTYTINVTVKDLHPINVTVNSKEYAVVKKADLLTNPTGYTPDTIKIDDQDIPAFKSDLTNFTLVGLKDEEGNVALYIYEDGKYTIYNEIKSNSLTLYPQEYKEMLKGFNKSIIKIDELEVDAFVSDNLTLIYAMNVETGKTGFYMYDKEENTFMRYNEDIFEAVEKENKELKMLLVGVSAVIMILLIIVAAFASKNSKLKKYLLKTSTQSDTENGKRPKKVKNVEVEESTEEIKKDED